VDTARADKLKINFDIDFPRMPCLCESIGYCESYHHHHLILSKRWTSLLTKDGLDRTSKNSSILCVHRIL
jgi:hypothetical protein